jgi:hypothetical protein
MSSLGQDMEWNGRIGDKNANQKGESDPLSKELEGYS